MLMKQISIFVENKRGRLAQITKTLAENNVDIRAMSIADTTDYGILRLIVDDAQKAIEVLKKADMTVSITNVIATEVADKPGGFANAIETLSDAGLAVEYAYAFITPRNGVAYVILRVDDNDKAIEVLTNAGLTLVSEDNAF